MPNFGDTREHKYVKRCPLGAGVECTQTQVYARVWYRLWLGGAWFDKGEPYCGDCPTGKQSKDLPVILCCFAGARAAAIAKLNPPGIVNDLVKGLGLADAAHAVFGDMPPGAVLLKMHPCYEVTANMANPLLKNLELARDQLKAMGAINEVQTQQNVIDCLKDRFKEFGWL